jgi:hypothetical protein
MYKKNRHFKNKIVKDDIYTMLDDEKKLLQTLIDRDAERFMQEQETKRFFECELGWKTY